MTLKGTPRLVSPTQLAAGLRFRDEALTANQFARYLRKRRGVHAIVVLLHEGGFAVQKDVGDRRLPGAQRADQATSSGARRTTSTCS